MVNFRRKKIINMKICNCLINTKDIKKSSYIWNIIAYTGNSFQSMLLMLVMSRKKNMVDVAMFSIAFTVSSMLILIGKYAVRNYQVSDIKGEYTFGDYIYARVVTMLGMTLVSIFYLVLCYLYKEYSLDKIICVILVLSYRFLEVLEDAFHGNLQKHGRLDVASKIWSIRTWGYIICYTMFYLLTGEILVAAMGSLIIAIISCIILNAAVYNLFPGEMTREKGKIWQLLKSCFPLAVSTFSVVYIANSPKYTVDAVFTSEEQACFNIVFMPVFVITLLGNYIYNPIVKSLAVFWKEGAIKKIKKIMYRQVLVLMFFTGIVALCGEWFGVRLLGVIYKVELQQYELEFVLLMIAGGALAIFNFLIVISTVIRRQKILIYISVAFSIILLVGNKMALHYFGMRYMCIFYATAMVCMAFITFVLDMHYVNHGDKGEVLYADK